jgi:ribosomal subunit interface protein
MVVKSKSWIAVVTDQGGVTLELHIFGHNMEITDKAREHVESKLDQIDRHLPGISGATVELAHEATRSTNDRIVAQVTLNISGTLLRAQ